MALSDHFNRTLTVYRPEITPDAVGGQTRTEWPEASLMDVPCMVQARRTKRDNDHSAGRIAIEGDHIAYTDTAVDARPNDRVVVTPGLLGDVTDTFISHGAANQAGLDRVYAIYLERTTT